MREPLAAKAGGRVVLGWLILALFSVAGCTSPPTDCITGLPATDVQGYWHQAGLFSAAVKEYQARSPTPPWSVYFDVQTGKQPRLPFADANMTAMYGQAVALGGVVVWSGKTQFLLRTQGDDVAINVFHYVSAAEADGHRFLAGIAVMNATQQAVLEQALLTSDTGFWTGHLNLRLTDLFHSLHPKYQPGNSPAVDAPWQFNFEVDTIHVSTMVDGVPVNVQFTGWDNALLDFTGHATQDQFRPLTEHLFSQLRLPAPSFEGLAFSMPC